MTASTQPPSIAKEMVEAAKARLEARVKERTGVQGRSPVVDDVCTIIAALEAAEARAQDAELSAGALHAIRRACSEIMGGNTTFVDDDFARCLITMKAERDAAYRHRDELFQANNAYQGRYRAAEKLLRKLIADEDEAPGFGIADCVDNRGIRCQSQGFADLITEARALLSTPNADPASPLPADVVRLVIAAREVAFGDVVMPADNDGAEALKALDAASEAFADRVPWEYEPNQPQEEA